MAAAWSTTTGRGMYTMTSYNDYPTSAELIDWAWGRLHIHAYTQEVYQGYSASNPDTWYPRTTPPDQWIYMGDWQGLHEHLVPQHRLRPVAGQGLPFQDKLVAGVKDSFVVMALSEPNGMGAIVPDWIVW